MGHSVGKMLLKFITQSSVSRSGDREATCHDGIDCPEDPKQKSRFEAVQVLVEH